MIRIFGILFQVLILSVLSCLSSCAIVTVNIYFPAEEVKEAYKSLEEEFVKSPEGTPEKAPQKPKGQPQSLRYPEKPQLESRKVIVLKRRFSIDISTPSWAQSDLSQQIANEIRNMPDVVQAFRNRGKRVTSIKNLLSEGKVGEGNKGLLVKRGSLTPQETVDFNAENSDRQIIINGMAKAIVKINNLEPTFENINRVLPQAAEQFAAVRREEAKPGWWIQLPDGSWMQR